MTFTSASKFLFLISAPSRRTDSSSEPRKSWQSFSTYSTLTVYFKLELILCDSALCKNTFWDVVLRAVCLGRVPFENVRLLSWSLKCECGCVVACLLYC